MNKEKFLLPVLLILSQFPWYLGCFLKTLDLVNDLYENFRFMYFE